LFRVLSGWHAEYSIRWNKFYFYNSKDSLLIWLHIQYFTFCSYLDILIDGFSCPSLAYCCCLWKYCGKTILTDWLTFHLMSLILTLIILFFNVNLYSFLSFIIFSPRISILECPIFKFISTNFSIMKNFA